MARGYLLDDFAEADLDEAMFWYEAEEDGLGLRFMDAVHKLAREVVDFPQMGTPAPDLPHELGIRRIPVKPFPYWLVTMLQGDVLVVIAVASQIRLPDYWHDRVPKR